MKKEPRCDSRGRAVPVMAAPTAAINLRRVCGIESPRSLHRFGGNARILHVGGLDGNRGMNLHLQVARQ